MSYYGITKINWDASHTFIQQVLLHKITKSSDSPDVGFDDGKPMPFHEVASLIHGGDHVCVLVPDGTGHYDVGDKVRIKPGQHEYLESVDEAGNPSSSLSDLVAWNDE